MSSNAIKLYTPPSPTLLDPHAQIKWIFSLVESEYCDSTAASIGYAKNKYIEYVSATNAYYVELASNRRFYLSSHWEVDALIRFNKWLFNQNLASKTRYGIYKSVRKVMHFAYALRIVDTVVYSAPVFKGVRETKERAAYSEEELEVINAALARWVGLAYSVLQGYTPSGNGIPYRRNDALPPIEVDGTFYSVGEAARVFGVAYGTITERLKKGWSAKQALGLHARQEAAGLNWAIGGEVFQSVGEVAIRFGLPAHVVRYRARAGWSAEQIVGLVEKPKLTGKAIQTVVNGVVFCSFREACRHFHIDHGIAKQRVARGWSVDEALGLEKREAHGTKIVVEGIKYHSMSAAAKAYGLDHSIVCGRLRKGLTPEQAVGIMPIVVKKSDDRALLWMFENIYGCDASAMFEAVSSQKQLYNRVCTEKRLLKLFARWGVWPHVDDRIVMPLAVEMAMLTGLNFESLKALEIDSLQLKHRLTGQPVITYHKKRSGSATRSEDRELHLHILEVEELYLEDSVSEKVIRLWGLVTAITSRIRELAPPEWSRTLFIFEHVEQSRRTGVRTIVPIEPKGKASKWYGRFCREEGLYELFGERFNFSIARCRPTLATNMVLAGAHVFQVQVTLGHESTQTTASYLDSHRLRPAFHKTISEAMEGISRRSRELREASEVEPLPDTRAVEDAQFGLYETLSGCGCMNPYQPSEHIRELTKLRPGAVCKHWNMCLLCDNAVVTENSLPKLILYRNRVAAALEGKSPALKARTELYVDAIKLIDGMLARDVVFPAQVVDRAEEIAATMDDLLVDQLIYQGV